MSEMEKGAYLVICLALFAFVACAAGWLLGRTGIADDCKRWGEFDRFSTTYVCKVKP